MLWNLRALLILAVLTTSFILLIPRVYAKTPDWSVTIGSRLGSFYSGTTLGVASDATNGFDTDYDAVAPPAPPDGIISYFSYPSDPTPAYRKLSTSIIPQTANMNWTLKVATVGESGTLVLNWTTIPPHYSAFMEDSAGNILADMSQTTQYSTAAEADVTISFTVSFIGLPPPSYPIGRLNGDVRDVYAQQPIASASVNVTSNNGTIFLLTTYGNGYYTLDVDESFSSFNVTVTAPCYVDGFVTGVVVTGGMVTTQNFALRPSLSTLQVTVKDKNTNQPIASATVLVDDYNGSSFTLPTNATGQCAMLFSEDVTRVNITVSASGYVPEEHTSVYVTYGETIVQQFTLQPIEVPPELVVPEVPFGTIAASAATLLALLAYFAISKSRGKP